MRLSLSLDDGTWRRSLSLSLSPSARVSVSVRLFEGKSLRQTFSLLSSFSRLPFAKQTRRRGKIWKRKRDGDEKTKGERAQERGTSDGGDGVEGRRGGEKLEKERRE